MRAYRILATALLLALTSGCVVVWGDGGGNGGNGSDRGNGSPVRPQSSSEDVVTPALRDVERFWKNEYPELARGAEFKPVGGGFHPYTRNDPPPACGDQPGEYQPNAFYCPAGDFIAWDAQELIPQLQAQFGPLLVGVVMAHEYGHAIQTRLGRTKDATVVLEQQADCYAGAWTADVLAGNSTAFKDVKPEQLDDTVAGLLLLRDQPGTSAAAPGAHGNAFDRVRAFQDGVEDGAATCAGYDATNLPVTEVEFQTPRDAANGGDLPYDDAINALAQDAQTYWTGAYPDLTGQPWQQLRVTAFTDTPPACDNQDAAAGDQAFYCPEGKDGDFAAFDTATLGPQLYERIGDNAVGMLIGDLFARAVQDRRGVSTQDRAGQLAVDCLAGTWTSSILARTSARDGIQLSPGDLDEAVTALLAFGRSGDGSGTTAFERIGAYRDGVLEGLSGCQ